MKMELSSMSTLSYTKHGENTSRSNRRPTIPRNNNGHNNNDHHPHHHHGNGRNNVNSALLPSFPTMDHWKEAWPEENSIVEFVHFFFTEETYKMAVNIYKFCALIKVVPFELESGAGDSLRVRPFRRWWQRFLWHVVNWMMFGMIAFQFVSFFFLWRRVEFGTDIAFHIFFLVLAAWVFVFFFPLYRNPDECILMLNQHDYFIKHSQRLGLGYQHWASHPLVTLAVYYLAWAFTGLSVIMTLFYLRIPNKSQYLYSAFPASWKGTEPWAEALPWSGQVNWYLYISFTFYEFYIWAAGCSMICIYLCYWCADIYSFNTALKELGKRRILNEQTIEAYLTLQIFCNTFNDFNGGLFATGFCTVLLATPILFTYMALTTFDLLSLLVYLLAPTLGLFCVGIILMFLPQHAKVQIRCKLALGNLNCLPVGPTPRYYLDSRPQAQVDGYLAMDDINRDIYRLTSQQRIAYFRRRVKAFRPLRIQISFFGSFSIQTPAVMIDQLFNNIILLLSL